MKFLIVFACLLAIIYANEEANIIKSDVDVNIDNFHYVFELDNSIKAIQHGELKDKETWLVHGEYEYKTKDDKHVKVSYTADEYGYHPKIENIA